MYVLENYGKCFSKWVGSYLVKIKKCENYEICYKRSYGLKLDECMSC